MPMPSPPPSMSRIARVYGHANEEAEVWMKELRAHVIGEMPKARVVAAPDEAAVRDVATTRPIRLFGRSVSARGA